MSLDVTVIVPAFRAERWIEQAIASVFAQTLPPKAVIVVDDGSPDDTASRVAASHDPHGCVAVQLIRQANAGVSAARNRGAEYARTEWLAFLDADDALLPDRLARQALAAEDADVLLCDLRRTDETLAPLEPATPGRTRVDLESLLLHRPWLPRSLASSLIVRRALFEEVGGLDPQLSTAADWDLVLRLALRGRVAYTPERLVLYRQLPGSMSRSAAVLERDSRRVLDKAFADPALPASLARLERRARGWNDLVLAGAYHAAGQRRRAALLGIRGLVRDPEDAWERLLGYPGRALGRLLSPPSPVR